MGLMLTCPSCEVDTDDHELITNDPQYDTLCGVCGWKFRGRFDLTEAIIEYETGQLQQLDVLRLFSRLIREETVSHLQGTYHRAASDFVHARIIALDGTILTIGEIEQ